MNILSAVFCVADTIYCPPGDEFGGSLHECQGWEQDKKLLLPLRATSDHVCNAQLIGVTLDREHWGRMK